MDRAPSGNYRALPSSRHIDSLVEEIRNLRNKIERTEKFYHIREDAFKEALAAVKGK